MSPPACGCAREVVEEVMVVGPRHLRLVFVRGRWWRRWWWLGRVTSGSRLREGDGGGGGGGGAVGEMVVVGPRHVWLAVAL